jgi:hypothetical protein
MADSEELTGTVKAIFFRSEDSDFIVAELVDGKIVCGDAPVASFVPRMTYRFYGKWKVRKGKDQFVFEQYKLQEPHTRVGVVTYLSKFATNIGPAIANRLFDVYGTDAVKELRGNWELVAETIKGLTRDRARAASQSLQAMKLTEDVRQELATLFHGRGFHGRLVDDVIRKYGILAPQRIKRDPLCLLVEGFASCGFARCDSLYCDLGLPQDALKRQTICIWHLLREDSNSTWLRESDLVRKLGEMIGGTVPDAAKAIKLGIRSGWLARFEDEAGVAWLAEGEKANHEVWLAGHLRELMDVECNKACLREQGIRSDATYLGAPILALDDPNRRAVGGELGVAAI